MSGCQGFLLPLQRKPCNRPKINFASIRRRQFSLTFLVIGWKKFFWIFSNFVSDWAEFNLAMLIFFVSFWLIAWKKNTGQNSIYHCSFFSFPFEDWPPEKNLGFFAILGLFRSFSLFSFSFIFFNSWFFSFFKQLMMSNILAIICTWKVTWRPLV